MHFVDKRILLTGGAGCIGSRLARILLSNNNDVVLADDFSNGRKAWIPDGVEAVTADLTVPENVAEVVDSDIDFVFHLAARKDPKTMIHTASSPKIPR